MIELSHLSKTYRVPVRPPGLGAALRSLVRRTYRDVPAVVDLSFSIAKGERVGFLGPNGAGKTTTLKMLSGLLWPTSGEVRVLGMTPKERPVALLRRISLVMGQKAQLLWDLPPADTFDLQRAVYDLDRKAFLETKDELVTLLELSDVIHKPTRQLSLGERMRAELAAALLHRPEILFLDEPTIGLDVTMQAVVRRFLREYVDRHGATLLLTSHYMEDVKALCPRVILIDDGRLVHDGALDALVARYAPTKRVRLRLETPYAGPIEAFGEVVEHEGERVVFEVPAARLADAVRRMLAELVVVDLTVEDPPLADTMARIFADDAASPASGAR